MRFALASPRRRIRRRIGSGTAPSARRRQVWYENLAVLRGLSGVPEVYGRQAVTVTTDRAQMPKRCCTKVARADDGKNP